MFLVEEVKRVSCVDQYSLHFYKPLALFFKCESLLHSLCEVLLRLGSLFLRRREVLLVEYLVLN